jgi:hypothetical protein
MGERRNAKIFVAKHEDKVSFWGICGFGPD